MKAHCFESELLCCAPELWLREKINQCKGVNYALNAHIHKLQAHERQETTCLFVFVCGNALVALCCIF